MVMFIYRDQYYLEKAEPTRKPEEDQAKFDERYDSWRQRCEEAYGLAEVIVAKQRHGPTGKRLFHFEGETTKFSDYVAPDHTAQQY